MSRRSLPIVLVVLAGMMLATIPAAVAEDIAPAASGAVKDETNAPSKVLRIASQDDVKGLNPFAVNDVWSSNVIYYVFDGLVNRDWKTDQIQPWVAVEWCTESKATPGGCSKDDADENVLNITVRYKVGDWASKYGGPIKFHDGKEVTIDDIIWSYAMVPYNGRWVSSVKDLLWKKSEGYDWNTPPYGESGWQKVTIGGVGGEEGWLTVRKKPGESGHAIEFRLKQPYADFFQDTISTVVFPKHVWDKHINTQDGTGDYLQWELDHKEDGTAPGMVGSGPFKFNKWVQGQFARNDRNTDFFDWTKLPKVDTRGRIVYPTTDCTTATPQACAYDPAWTRMQPIANIEAAEYKIYLTTESAALALQQADVDLVAWSIPPSMVNEMQTGDKCTDLNNVKVNCGSVVGLEKTSERGFFYTAFNMRRETFGYKDFPNNDLTDVGAPFRQAVAYSTDKATIVSQVLQGYGKAALGPVSPDLRLWHNDSLPAYPLDEAKGNAILDAAGWTRDTSCPKIGNPPDHARRFPVVGCNLIEMLTPEAAYDPVRAVAGQMIEAAAQKVGINLKSVPTAFGKIVTQITARDFQMFILGWRIGSDPGGYMRSFFHCTEEKAGNNYQGYCNKQFDDLMDEFDQTFNQTRRVEIIKDQQGLLVKDLPYNVLYFRDSVEAFRKDRFVVPILSPPSWIKGVAGIFNSWSLQLIDSPSTPTTLTVTGAKEVNSGRTARLTVTYLASGQPVDGAKVTATIASGPLTFAGGATSTETVTDGAGVAQVVVFANAGVTADTPATVDFLVSKDGFQDARVSHGLIVHKADTPGVYIDSITITPQAIQPGGQATITVVVLNLMDSSALAGAKVTFLAPDLGALDLNEKTTAANGEVKFVFSVAATVVVQADTPITLRATATGDIGGNSYTSEESSGTVTIQKKTDKPTTVPGFEAIALIGAAGAAMVAFTAVYARRRRA